MSSVTERKRRLAEQGLELANSVASAGIAIGVGGPLGTLIGAVTPSVLSTLSDFLQRLEAKQRDNVLGVISLAAKQAGIDPDVLIERLEAEPVKSQLFVRTLRSAQDEALMPNLVFLAQSLGHVVTAALDVDVLREAALIRAISELDAGHLRLLRAIMPVVTKAGLPEGPIKVMTMAHGRSELAIERLLPEFKGFVPGLVAALQSHGLVAYRVNTSPAGFRTGAENGYWEVTPMGKGFLERMSLAEEMLRRPEGQSAPEL